MISVIILTYNEEVHIERCISSLLPFADKVFIVDSFSTDNTVSIARKMGADVVSRAWKNYADQFQWAINNCGVESDWLMRMDADEYLEPDLIDEISEIEPVSVSDIDGIYIRRKVFFQQKWIKHGGFYPQTILRIWRKNIGHIEQRWMDEHIVIGSNSNTLALRGNIVDDNKKGITFWIEKHNSYATREMADAINQKYAITKKNNELKNGGLSQAKFKRILKEDFYTIFPLSLRSFLYFIYRYIFRCGFLDGGKGFLWHFMQGFWYRLLVDIKISEIEKKSGGDVEKIIKYLKEDYGIILT